MTLATRMSRAVTACLVVTGGCSESDSPPATNWTLAEELRIGSESRPEYALTAVRAIAVSEDGRIFVLQPDDGMVRVFDADGNFLTYIGRSGEGPGEFARIGSFGLNSDTLWVTDNRGIHRFESTGRFLGTEMFMYDPPEINLGPSDPGQIFADGTFSVIPSFIPTLDASTWPDHLPLQRMDGDRVLSELAAFDLDMIRLFTVDGRSRAAIRPFVPFAVHAYAPDRRSFATVSQVAAEGAAEATFRLSRIGFEGDTIFSRDVAYAPLPVPTSIRDSIEASVPAQIAAARFEAAPIPQNYPPVQALTIAADNSIWVDLQGHQPSRWLVLDSVGDYVANASSGEVMRVFVVRGEMVWGVVKDELDVPYVVRARIVRNPG